MSSLWPASRSAGSTLDCSSSGAICSATEWRGSPLAPELAGWSIEFRLPDSRDMQAAASCAGADAARLLLIDRCVLKVTSRSQTHPVADAPAELIAAMEDAMAAADPQADVRFNLV